MIFTQNTQGHPIGWMSDKDWQNTIDILVETKAIEKAMPIADFYTNDFIPAQ